MELHPALPPRVRARSAGPAGAGWSTPSTGCCSTPISRRDAVDAERYLAGHIRRTRIELAHHPEIFDGAAVSEPTGCASTAPRSRSPPRPTPRCSTVLRNELGLFGSRFGCGLGLCGACFVRLDGAVVPSCDTPLWAAAGRSVVTVEGLAPDGELHPVQQALLDHQAAQCGFCISGIAVRAAALLEETPAPDADTVAAGARPQPVPLRRPAPDHRRVVAAGRRGRHA